jgi:hypothetical protein
MFEELNLPIPESVNTYDINTQKSIYNYLSSLKEIDRKAYLIAYNHLGTTFNILKSVGYREWLKAINNNK